jgi:hypothetical protein
LALGLVPHDIDYRVRLRRLLPLHRAVYAAGHDALTREETNQRIEGLEVDCVWREQRLAVELDGRSYHDTLRAYERDRLLQAAGWRPIRVTWRQLERSRAALERDLRRMYEAVRPWPEANSTRHAAILQPPAISAWASDCTPRASVSRPSTSAGSATKPK